MNILHVESSFNWGGQEHRTLAETRWLNGHGHRGWIACNPNSELRRRAPDVALDLPMRASFAPRASIEVRRLCRQLAIDVVHVHSPKDAWICYPLHLAGVPVIRSRQITNPVIKKWSRSVIYRRGCAKIIATADCIRRDLIARNGVDPSRIAVVGEGVDPQEFHPGIDGSAFRTEFGVAPDALLFGVVAMIRPEKGHRIFIQAALEFLRRHPSARFAIIGEGTGNREAERENRDLLRAHFGDERSGPIFMTGFRTDIPAVMAALDALVVPSTAEAQSLVVPQAFATRKPVIASAVGGLPELVRHQDTGLLVPPGCTGSLAAAMLRVAEDHPLRERLAKRGYEYATQHLVFDRKMEQSLAIYGEACAAKPSTRYSRDSSAATTARGLGVLLNTYLLERGIFRPRSKNLPREASALLGSEARL